MSSLPAAAATAVALFAGTNVDDLVVLALLNAAALTAGRPRRWEIWVGQYLGFAVLVGLSLAAGRGLSLLPARWLWLLALIPITAGAVTLVRVIAAVRRGERPAPPSAGGLLGVAALTLVDGADNLAGSLLVRRERITGVLARHGHWILPIALILIGLYTLQRTAHAL